MDRLVAVELHGVGVGGGVAVVHPVDVLGQQDHIGPDLGGAKHGGGIRGEEGAAHAAAEDHHPALFQVPDGTGPYVGLHPLPNLQVGTAAVL